MSLPGWLESFLFEMALKFGIPMLKKMLPFLPEPFWVALQAFIQHLWHEEDPTPKVSMFMSKVEECMGIACPSTTK